MSDLVAHLHPGWLQFWQDKSMEYMRYKYKLMPHDLVIDLGAYQGDFAEEINNQHGCQVICVEPTDSIRRLEHKPWCRIVQKAADTKEGTVRFGGCFYYSSLYETDEKYGFKDYPTIDVNSLLTQPVALLKVNIEGMEYDILPHILASGLQSNVENFQIQFHIIDHESEKKYAAIAKKLSETHEPEWRCNFVWESWRKRKP